jgi:molecular chaperone DnaJ
MGREMPTTRDYYEVLGVSREADPDAIKQAFRERATALHTNVSDDPKALEEFEELKEAYRVLSRPSTRRLYDRFGYRGRGHGWFAPAGAGARAAGDFVRRRRPPVAEVLLDELEAERGVRREVRWSHTVPCDACGGRGGAPGALEMACPACDGTGKRQVESSLAGGEGAPPIDVCAACGGRGRVVSEPCPACDGAGAATIDQSAEVDVPAGVTDGTRLRVGTGGSRTVLVRVFAAPPDRPLLRYVAAAGLLVALVCFWLLLR